MSMMMPPGAPPMGPPPPPGAPMGEPMMDGGEGLPPELMAALSGGGDMASQEMMAEGPAEGMDAEEADEESGERDALSLIREAIALLREAGTIEEDDMRSHMIDKTQADLQKILSSEAQKTSKLRSALGG